MANHPALSSHNIIGESLPEFDFETETEVDVLTGLRRYRPVYETSQTVP